MNARLLSSVVLIGVLLSFATGQPATSSPTSTNSTTKSVTLTTILTAAIRTVNNTHESTTWPTSWSTPSLKPQGIKDEVTTLPGPESTMATVSESSSNPAAQCKSPSHSIEAKEAQSSQTEITEMQTSPIETSRESAALHGQMTSERSVLTAEGQDDTHTTHTKVNESLSSETEISESPVTPAGVDVDTLPTEESESSTPSTETLQDHTNTPLNPTLEAGKTKDPEGKKEDIKEVIRLLKKTENEVVQVKEQVNKLLDQSVHKIDSKIKLVAVA